MMYKSENAKENEFKQNFFFVFLFVNIYHIVIPTMILTYIYIYLPKQKLVRLQLVLYKKIKTTRI